MEGPGAAPGTVSVEEGLALPCFSLLSCFLFFLSLLLFPFSFTVPPKPPFKKRFILPEKHHLIAPNPFEARRG